MERNDVTEAKRKWEDGKLLGMGSESQGRDEYGGGGSAEGSYRGARWEKERVGEEAVDE